MSPLASTALVLAAIAALYWLVAALFAELIYRKVPQLDRPGPAPAVWPRVSVLIPACDEAATIEPALRAHLASDYPALEVVAVDDRSTDATGAIIDRLAAADPRLRALHIRQLPAGWLGKVHALHCAVQQAHGDWLLVTDADVELEPAALRAAISLAEARQLDFLTLLPRLRSVGLLVDATVAVFNRGLLGMGRVWQAADPEVPVAFGIGAFCLVRRSALLRTPGFEWLRLEVADDMGLALLIKRAGGRCAVANGRQLIAITFYTSVGEMARRLEKNAWAIMGQFNLARLVGLSLLLPAIELALFAGLLPLGVRWLPLASAALLVLASVHCVRMSRWIGLPAWSGLLFPIGAVMIGGMLIRGGVISARAGGIRWRQDFYRTAELRAGSRLRWGS